MSKNLLENFDKLTIWRRRGERAPHKPLLALWAIGRCLRGEDRLVEYEVIHASLVTLLRSFGPPRRNYKPQEPFWRMQKDEIWEVTEAHRVPEQSNGSVSPSDLRRLNVCGGLPSKIYETFRQDRVRAQMVAERLVDAHFPQTMRAAVLEATLGEFAFNEMALESGIGIEHSPLLASILSRRSRTPQFRNTILRTYDYRCAVCGYSFQFPEGYWPALEAAHIQWHSHCGPDISTNGLSLCALHHELFDWGIFTVQPDTLSISVATDILRQLPENTIANYHGTPLQVVPKRNCDYPAAKYLDWHSRNVFRD